ncbi:UNVERIFIED_CONTAM: hypothetical protein GTU68_011558 [Idotea baltica]|nr:hypothetical protein [Idotea baltica]
MQVSCHKPVLLSEVIESFSSIEGGRFLDCTFGGGGHTRAILEAHPGNTIVALDRNQKVKAIADLLEEEFGERFRFVNMPFSKIQSLSKYGPFNGILADFGLSSDQLDDNSGFSFKDEMLDMRMDQSCGVTAEEIINSLSEHELRNIFKRGGATKATGVVVKNIIKKRPVSSASVLANAILEVYPQKLIKPGRHPATVFFQALRMEVNSEISEIKEFLDASISILSESGILSVISFHSLEDKLVAKKFRQWSTGNLLTKKAITPNAKEINDNPRSRSALLRIFKKSS